MNSLSQAQQTKLNSCDADLIRIVNRVLGIRPLVVVCGHRNAYEQALAFNQGKSRVVFPKSRHNTFPSQAVDLAAVVNGKIEWKDPEAYKELAGDMKVAAGALGLRIEWGGDWTGAAAKLGDIGHFQLPKQEGV